MHEGAIPILPSRHLDATLEFYEGLGFEVVYLQDPPDAYAILRRGPCELHFVVVPDLDPSQSYAGCYLRVPNAELWHEELRRLRLPAEGIPRIVALEDRPWGMREFAIVDPNGTLLRIGWPTPGGTGER